ncbi:MAG: hypothetical protein GJ680_00180 [Alteromonadaceae bacterium]|nr:hypothetical protein [Alteromonadaceae bacterium]
MELFETIFSWLTSDKMLKLLIPVLVILLFEHLILRYCYNKPSSIERLLNPSQSAKTDMVAWSVYYIFFRFFDKAFSYLALPGLVFIAAREAQKHYQVEGVLGDWMPENFVLAVIIWLVVYDFPHYVSHWLMHKIPVLWRYHRYHHAAEEMNIITGIRISLAERFLNSSLHLAIAIALLGLQNPGVPFFALLTRRIIDLLQHSNLPWGYGWFGYILASPRFHKIHHSRDVLDFDRNYGNIFSFWDFIFRTHNSRYESDRRSADTCLLGLPDSTEAKQYNSPFTGIFRHTFLFPVFRYLSKIKSGVQDRRSSMG